MESTPRQALVNLIALAAILGCIFLFFRFFELSEVQAKIQEAGVWAPLILVAAKASTIVIAPLSGSPLYPIGGALFGFWKAFGLLLLGDMLGGSIAFFLSRIFGRRIVDALLSPHKGFVSAALEMMSSWRGFLLARLGFVTFPEVPAYAAGLSQIGYIPFVIIFTVVGMVPTAVTTALGALLTADSESRVFVLVLLFGAVVSGVSIMLFVRHVQQMVQKKLPHERVD